PPHVNEVSPFLVGGQSRADALRHDQHDRSVAEVEPIGLPEQLIFASRAYASFSRPSNDGRRTGSSRSPLNNQTAKQMALKMKEPSATKK
ncbi:MAG: hypothetical protein ACXW4C_11870, partial [Nitrospira sp.]